IWRALFVDCLRKNGRTEEARQQASLLPAAYTSGGIKFVNLEQPKDAYDGASFRQLRRLAQLQDELKHSRLALREHADLHFQEALEYLRDHMERQAVDELELVLEFDPEDARAYLELAAIHLNARHIEEARRLAHRALELEQTPQAYVLLARTYLAEERTAEARTAVEEALRLDATHSAALALRDQMTPRLTAR
ncbi:MAG TPA: hypothetical protein VNN17_02195, partial [Terriglobia bacterium]|nr:hypothetical protein [Terriglobia bacterium]